MTRIHGIRRELPPGAVRLIGAITLVVLAIAVYISYNSIYGLPFASTYDLTVSVPNADELIATDEVRIAGVRVGQVSDVTAVPAPRSGRPYARIRLALDGSTGRLPVDTRVSVQSSSVLGSTYVDLVPGTSARTVASGGSLPLRDGQPTVQLTDLLDIFNRSTAKGVTNAFGGLGDAFTARGAELNTTFSSLRSLLRPLTAVSRALAAPNTQLARFVDGYHAFTLALAPVAQQLRGALNGGAETFSALDTQRPALGRSIDLLPGAERATTSALDALDPALDVLAPLTVELRPAGALLPGALGQIDSTAAAGVAPLHQIPRLAALLGAALNTVRRVAAIPSTGQALHRLTGLLSALGQLLEVITPAQVQCNIISLFGINFSQAGRPGTGAGPGLANVSLNTLGGLGEELQHAAPSPNEHINYLPTENGQECASGNEPVTNKLILTNPTGPLNNSTRPTVPPPGVLALARKAGLITPPKGSS